MSKEKKQPIKIIGIVKKMRFHSWVKAEIGGLFSRKIVLIRKENKHLAKFLIALILVSSFSAPIVKAETVMMGEAYTTQIAPMEQIAEVRFRLIQLITELINALQQQLNQLLNQQATPSAQPSQQAPAGSGTQAQNNVEPYPFTPLPHRYPVDLAMVIADEFDTCELIIKDENSVEVLKTSTWMTDKDGNSRIVYTPGTPGQHTYQVTCHKAGYDKNTKEGKFPEKPE